MTKSTNTVEQEPAMSRRQIVMAAAGIATAGVIFTWFYQARSRPTTTADGPLVRPGKAKKLPPEQIAKELAKAGPLPEIVIGKEDAPITIVEYADLTCPACAAFHKTVLPQLKEKYIDTGKVRILFREFPTNWPGLMAFMTVRCAGAEKALPLISALFARQDDWRGATSFDQFREKLFSFGQQVGLTRQTFDSCTPASRTISSISPRQPSRSSATTSQPCAYRAHETFSVSSTPTFFVNGKRLPHATIEEFEKVLAPLVTP